MLERTVPALSGTAVMPIIVTVTLDWYHAVLIVLVLLLAYRLGYVRGWRRMRYTLAATQEKLDYYKATADSVAEPYPYS